LRKEMNRELVILGIHDGHNCGAALTINGMVVAAICEERLTRKKNEVGFPEKSILEVLRIAGISPKDLDEVAFASLFMHSPDHLKDLEPWYVVGLAQQRQAMSRPEDYRKMIFQERRAQRIRQVVDLLGVDESKIVFVEHHLAHLASAYYTNPNRLEGKSVLGITCDGAGDGIGVTVNVCERNNLKRISSTSRHASLGKIYSRVTMLMGMKPWEHEYKLMGLAPYADLERCRKAAEPLRSLLRVRKDGLGFEQVGELSTNYCYEFLREHFERVRFDVVAGATQLFTEEMLLDLVKGCIKHTGIRDIVCAGGVFMNVKANMLIAELAEVRSFYVMPSASDESLSIGACLQRYYEKTGCTDRSESVFENLYLGGDFSPEEEERAVQEMIKDEDVEIYVPEDMEMAICELLLKGEVVARFKGRMEWGARALGNRSILASADDYRVVERINNMIKQRDFWMPFAPSIRAESAERYFDDPKDLKPYYMTYAFRSKAETYPHLQAGSHPRDKTIRPQVYSPRDAIDVFFHSGLDHLALSRFLLSKKKREK